MLPYKVGSFWTRWETITLSRRYFLHWVTWLGLPKISVRNINIKSYGVSGISASLGGVGFYEYNSSTTHLWRGRGERMYSSYSFTNSALDRGRVASVTPRPRFSAGERIHSTHWRGAWVGPRAGLDTEVRGEILLPLPWIEPPSPGLSARSQTLHCLSYSGSYCMNIGRPKFTKCTFYCTVLQ
jgi:hypothetical protein